MSESADRAVALHRALARPRGVLPTLAEVDQALAAVQGLPMADERDTAAVRDISLALVHLRNAVVADAATG